MNLDVKLNCPICKKMFITGRRDKIYCGDICRDEHTAIKGRIDVNKKRQDNMRNQAMGYDFEEDVFFIRSLKTFNTLKNT